MYSVMRRKWLNQLPQNQRNRSMEQFKRHEKQVPGNRIQIDGKFLNFTDVLTKHEVKRFQYTAIDDATRDRVLHSYEQHTQQNVIDLLNFCSFVDGFLFA
jgi:hypothetical protein